MDWTAVMTLAFAGIGAATGLLTFGNEVSRRRAERQAARTAEAARWSLRATAMDEASQWKLRLRYGDARDRPVALRELRVVKPRSAEIAFFDVVASTKGFGVEYLPTMDGWRTIIKMDAALSPGYISFGIQDSRTLDYADYEILGRVTAPPQSRDGDTRFRISLTIEDMSAQRCQSHLEVASQEIDWTANSADKAT